MIEYLWMYNSHNIHKNVRLQHFPMAFQNVADENIGDTPKFINVIGVFTQIKKKMISVLGLVHVYALVLYVHVRLSNS